MSFSLYIIRQSYTDNVKCSLITFEDTCGLKSEIKKKMKKDINGNQNQETEGTYFEKFSRSYPLNVNQRKKGEQEPE